MMRATRLRDVRSPDRLNSAETLGGAADTAAGGVYLRDRRDRLGIAQVVRARWPLLPHAAAPPGDMERRAHLGYAPGVLVERDESEPRPLRPRAHNRLPARKAPAFKRISFLRLSLRFSLAILKELSSAGACDASALLA